MTAPSQSSSGGSVKVLLSGLLKSNHSLVLGLGATCLVLFALARESYAIVAYGSAFLVAVLVGVVAVRFAIKGPEAEHALPAVTFAGNQFQLINIDQATAEDLVRFAIRNRKALPLPSGVLQGPASDPLSIKLLSPTEAKTLQLPESLSGPGESGDSAS